MEKNIQDHLENEKLVLENKKLYRELKEAKEVIDAITRGKIDAVFTNNETVNVLTAKTVDQSYRRFIENMFEGVVTLHSQGLILYSNSSFARIVQLPLEKVIGTNFRNYIPVKYAASFEQIFNVDPHKQLNLEFAIADNKGILKNFIVSVRKLQLDDFMAINLVWTDLTDQKTEEEKLKTLNESLIKAIEERIVSEGEVIMLNGRLTENVKILEVANVELAAFAHIASHDLQEPLRKIITYSSLLMRDYHNVVDEKGQEFIKNMQKASGRMSNLIKDILEYAELSQKHLLFQPTDLQLIFNEVISMLDFLTDETKAEIIIEKKLPLIDAHPVQMKQLFQNLLGNALKFRRPGIAPKIHIGYELKRGHEGEKATESMYEGNFHTLYIKDNGIGFDPVYKDQIFTIFQKLHNNRTYQGTGIGLAICKKVVEQHNGFITADGNSEGGSIFTISLPAKMSGNNVEYVAERPPK